jgi:hypothetical protein
VNTIDGLQAAVVKLEMRVLRHNNLNEAKTILLPSRRKDVIVGNIVESSVVVPGCTTSHQSQLELRR